MNLSDVMRVLAERPECEHGLNGPCSVCGPSMGLEDTLTWRKELHDLGVIDDTEGTDT